VVNHLLDRYHTALSCDITPLYLGVKREKYVTRVSLIELYAGRQVVLRDFWKARLVLDVQTPYLPDCTGSQHVGKLLLPGSCPGEWCTSRDFRFGWTRAQLTTADSRAG
jgi:hypothetical protein